VCFHLYYLQFCISLYACANVICIKLFPVPVLFMHYFYNLSSDSGGFASIPPAGLHPWTSLGDFCPQTLNLPRPRKKNLAGSHVSPSLFYLFTYLLKDGLVEEKEKDGEQQERKRKKKKKKNKKMMMKKN